MASQLVGGYGFDTRDYKQLIRDLRVAQPEVARNLRLKLRAAGEVVAVEARAKAGQHSTTIPATIKVRTVGPRVEIRAGGPGIPIARLYETGNKGRGSSSTFKHPVYGNRQVWVEQKRYPFLKTAGLAKKAELTVLLHTVLTDLSREITRGLHHG